MTSPLKRGIPVVAACFVAMVVAVLAAPFIGSTSISFSRVFSTSIPFADNVDAQIFFIARLPRALARRRRHTLAAVGVVFQGLLRNPLATPTLSAFQRPSLGAMVDYVRSAWMVGGVASASLLGAFLAVAIVRNNTRASGPSITVLLLAGAR
jgi:iron complex transport system permease protein